MSVRTLVVALRALAPGDLTVHYGQAPSNAALPWVVLNNDVADVASRALASPPQAFVGRLLVTVAANTEDAVLILGDLILDAYEGARPVAEGWSVSPLRQVGALRVFADTSTTTTATNLRPMVGKVTFEYTATRA